ncbi:MAG: hypothetical protein KDE56_29405, partial [Anaerolineales bacterium]|nr:hypothetical protein [Anaerolineales bacterium]
MEKYVQLDLGRTWQITTDGEIGLAGKTAVFDLHHTLQNIANRSVTTQSGDSPTIEIKSTGGSGEGFHWQASPDHVLL